MFASKNILVVGASSGIGHALAGHLIAQQGNVYAASRRQPEGLHLAGYLPIDLAQPSPDFSALPPTLHGLAYCPGSITLKPFARLTADDFLKDFQINLLGAVRTIQAALPALKKGGNASIVLFSTVAVGTGMGFHASIAAAKGAVEGLARSLAAELAPNIRVNVVAPSLTDTPLAKQLLATPEKQEASGKRHPLGRVGTANDVAQAAAFLLSDQSSWITGQVLGVDGGMSALRPL